MLKKIFCQFKLQSTAERKITHDLIWSLFGFAVMAISGVLINVSVAWLHSDSALGIFNQAFAFYVILSQIAVSGLQFSALKHVAENIQSKNQLKSCIQAALIIGLILSLSVNLIFYYSIKFWVKLLDSEPLNLSLICLLPACLLFPLNKILMMSINGLRAMRAFSIFNALRYILIAAGILILTWGKFQPEILTLALSFSELILLLLLMFYLRNYIFSRNQFSPIATWLAQHLKFSVKGAFNGILIEANTRIDILLLGYYCSDAVVGSYSFASTLAEGIKQITAVVRSNVDPLLSQHFIKEDYIGMQKLFRQFRNSVYPGILLICILSIVTYPLLLWVLNLNQNYNASTSVFIIIIIGIAISSYASIFGGIIIQSGRPGWQSLLVLFTLILNALLAIIFIPIFGGNGAALAIALTLVAEACIIHLCLGLKSLPYKS